MERSKTCPSAHSLETFGDPRTPAPAPVHSPLSESFPLRAVAEKSQLEIPFIRFCVMSVARGGQVAGGGNLGSLGGGLYHTQMCVVSLLGSVCPKAYMMLEIE